MTIEKKKIRFESNQYIPGYGYAKGKVENVTTDVYQKLLAAGVVLTLLETFFETKVEKLEIKEEPLTRGIPAIDVEPVTSATEEQIKIAEEGITSDEAEKAYVTFDAEPFEEEVKVEETVVEENKVEVHLEELEVNDLKKIAKDLGITVKYHDKKSKIIDMIKKKQEAK